IHNMTRKPSFLPELFIIVVLAFVPLFVRLPYRVNIFLSWEGAYRMSQGQLPFRDFGIPLGGMYWVIPAIFFKLFGPALITLVKAQVLINILSGLSFLSILVSLGVPRGIRVGSVLLFCLSYSFFNFWPWYNHTVIVYELMGLACLLRGILPDGEGPRGRVRWGWLVAGALFTCCSFLTKQDGGGVAFLLCCVLLAADGWLSRDWRPIGVFIGSFAVIFMLMVLPFLGHGFGYWFNHGQAPHSSRVSPFDIAAEFFGSSQWIKFYLFLIILLAVMRYRNMRALRADRRGALLLVLVVGMLGEAAVLQVTSYTPPDNNIFFHSFAIPGIFTFLAALAAGVLAGRRIVIVLAAGVMLWWSGVWWKYTQRLTGPLLPKASTISPTGENVVNRDTYMLDPDSARRPRDIPTEEWVECGLPAFRRVTMPAPTADGIHRLMGMELVRSGAGNLRVLNMSELTPLAREIPYRLERNPGLPLWYHLGVGMFNRQADSFSVRIREHYYDLVLFEYIPNLNNFYPFRIRDSLHCHYSQVDSFPAPRRGLETNGVIEVFVRNLPK
ncbi:MAG TPA: hypothetical protein VG101_11650, partial [Puia sp.]|nr:hypothetical protein [Puia sp.]